jgi:hypothetical protein
MEVASVYTEIGGSGNAVPVAKSAMLPQVKPRPSIDDQVVGDIWTVPAIGQRSDGSGTTNVQFIQHRLFRVGSRDRRYTTHQVYHMEGQAVKINCAAFAAISNSAPAHVGDLLGSSDLSESLTGGQSAPSSY